MIRILIGVLILGVLAGGIWFTSIQQKNSSTEGAVTKNEGSTKKFDDSSFATTTSIIDLIALQKPISCTYIQNDAEVTGEGTVYLDGLSRFRVMGTQTRKDGTFDAHIIYTGAEMSMWVIGQGRTMAFTMPVEKPITELSGGNGAALDTKMVYDTVAYTCTHWDADDSMFTKPTDIDFVDMRTLMENMMRGVPRSGS